MRYWPAILFLIEATRTSARMLLYKFGLVCVWLELMLLLLLVMLLHWYWQWLNWMDRANDSGGGGGKHTTRH